MENIWPAKSRIIRAVHIGARIIIIVSIVVPVVFSKSGFFSKPNSLEGFLKRWLSPPYIYLILNLVIVSIAISSSLWHYMMSIANYFKGVSISTHDENSARFEPRVSSSSTTTTTLFNDHFHESWQDFFQEQTPSSLSPLDPEPFDEPWLVINDVRNSRTIDNFSNGREGMVKKKLEKNNSCDLNVDKILDKGAQKAVVRRETKVSPLLLNDINLDDDTLDGTWKAIMKGEKKTNSTPSSFGNKGNNINDTLEGTWKAIVQKGENGLSPSLFSNETERSNNSINVPSRLISPRVPRQDALAAWRELRKSETFNELVRQRGGLRRDPSLSLDDLNYRVESFIKNFNHQMLLQRQESEQRFLEMVNSGG